jgi:hypothetical protein
METMTRDEIAYTLEHANTALRTMVSLINRDWTTPHMREHLLAEIATLLEDTAPLSHRLDEMIDAEHAAGAA